MATPTGFATAAKSTAERMFPTLTSEQIARVAARGRVRPTRSGEVLFDAGAAGVGFFLVTAGQVELVRQPVGVEELVMTLERGQFTGEVNMLLGRPPLVRARASGAAEVVEMDRAHMLALIQTDAEIGEMLMRAFIVPRVELIAQR